MARFSHRRRSALERRLMRRAAAADELIEAEAAPSFKARPRSAGECWPDLLHHTPLVTADIELVRAALRFGFESGDAGGLLTGVVDDAPAAPSGFGQGSLTRGLFVRELLSGLATIPTDEGELTPSLRSLERLLQSPPDDTRDITLRQGILQELIERPVFQERLMACLVGLRRLRDLLDDRPMTTGETVQRKIEVLTLLRTFVEGACIFADAKSALRRLGTFATDIRDHAAFGKLVDILHFEGRLAELQVRIVLDYQGRIRDCEVVQEKDEPRHPVVRSPWRRLWQKLMGWLKGDRYGEHEILLRIIDDIFETLEERVLPLFSLIGHLEFYAAAMAFRARVDGAGLATCLPSFVSDADSLDDGSNPTALVGLFNPLLLLQDGVTPVPCDFAMNAGSLVLITGPNSGGKTRLLQAVALSQMLGQAGFFVPAQSARLTPAPKLFVSLIESAPALHKEGRLGTELLRVRHLFENLQPGCLVVLDELCSGTNPSEGIAIFEMVLSLLPKVRPQALLTTHFLDAARRLHEESAENPESHQALSFLQVDLDDDEVPTYQFVPGVAPTSLAHAVAARLGVTQGELEALVTEHIQDGPIQGGPIQNGPKAGPSTPNGSTLPAHQDSRADTGGEATDTPDQGLRPPAA